MLALVDESSPDPFVTAFRNFCRGFPKPKAIVVVSAHGLANQGIIEITASESPQLVYDFRGFPGELYQVNYACPGDPKLAVQIASLLADHGFQTELTSGGLDHGVWVPARIAYPEANIPVIQVSMPFLRGAREVLKMGKALSPLRGESVLLIGSGGAVHNLKKMRWSEKNSEGSPQALEFQEWVKKMLIAKDVESLLTFDRIAPNAEWAHPTLEHFYPLFFTIGAAWPGDEVAPIFEGIEYHSLSMLSFALVDPSSWAQ